MVFFIITLILFIFSSPLHAQEFSAYQENPVLKKDGVSTYVAQPFVSKNENTFTAWFSDGLGGKGTIGTMKSANGIDWYDKKTVSVSNKSIGDPFMFESNNEYQLYFAAAVNGPISIWKSTSSDGVTFVPGQEKEIIKPVQAWERFSVSSPSLFQDQSTQYMFYSGAGPSVWAIGMATSTDGITWQKCTNNPIAPEGSGPQAVKYNSIYYLFYHSSLGVQVQQTNSLNGCDTVWTNRHVVPLSFMDPAPLVVGSDLWIYGYMPTTGSQGIGLAGNVQILKPTYPIVIIPGMFSSWNKDALLHNTDVPYDTWKLNPAVSEYDALRKTLENKGRTENRDYFLFPYDWRTSVEDITNELNSFLSHKIWSNSPYQPIQIVGHSLGGVVSRIYTDKNPSRPIKQIITAGSPLLGEVQAYQPLATGKIVRENTLVWLAEKLILLLSRSGNQSDKDIIAQKLPILFDILPAFSFLRNESGTTISSTLTNLLISQYPIKTTSPIPQLYFGGSGIQTLAGHTLGSDGYPISSWNEDGDGVVLLKSSLNAVTPAPLQNHGEIIYSKESIKTILSKLNMQVEESEIPEGHGTRIFPAILAFIQSPATIQISHNGVTTEENEGMIWIQDAENGEYIMKVIGTGEGEYIASVWLIGATEDKWIQFKKTTSTNSSDRFTIMFDSETGGTAQEYIAPSPTPTLTPTPTPTPTSFPTPTPSPSPSSSSSSNVSSQTTQSVPDQNIYPPKKDYLAESIFTPLISDTPQNVPSIPKVLGTSVKNERKQKKDKKSYGGIIFLTLLGMSTSLIYWKRTDLFKQLHR